MGEEEEGGDGCAPQPRAFLRTRCGKSRRRVGEDIAAVAAVSFAPRVSPKMGAVGLEAVVALWGDEAVVVAPRPQGGCNGWPRSLSAPRKLGLFSAGPGEQKIPGFGGKFRNSVIRLLQEMGPCRRTAVVPPEVGPGPCLSCPGQVGVVWGPGQHPAAPPNPDLARPVWIRPHRSPGLAHPHTIPFSPRFAWAF